MTQQPGEEPHVHFLDAVVNQQTHDFPHSSRFYDALKGYTADLSLDVYSLSQPIDPG